MSSTPDAATPVLEVRDLKTVFHTREGAVHAVNGVSFEVRTGELLGVVGESGSGKSVTMMSVMNLHECQVSDVSMDMRWAMYLATEAGREGRKGFGRESKRREEKGWMEM